MKEIIQWLRQVELLASEIYLQAALIHENDSKLKKFLETSAEDEAWHYHVMGSAAEYIASVPGFTPAISINKETNDKIIGYLEEIKIGLEQNTIGRDELIEKIVVLELSEWNDIFLYVVNVLKEKTSLFKYPALRMQAHIKKFEYYLEKVEGKPQILDKIKEIPLVWFENILIVDDEEMLATLIKARLNRTGNIDVAHNGKDALKMMEDKYYKLIISDIDMPVMDGISFYKEAIIKYPTSRSRFLFMTGHLSPDRQAFFDENHAKYLEKPMDINVLRKIAGKIIYSE